MKKKVFVTGATGFIGSNIVRALVAKNFQVHISTRKRSHPWRIKEILPKLHIYEIDLLEKNKLTKIMEKLQPDIIIHLANLGLYSGVDFSLEESIKTNLLGTVNLIESTDKIDYECFINTGSSSEYGDKKKPMHEDNMCLPTSNYALAKLTATLYAKTYAEKTKKSLLTLRLFSPFGPYDQSGRFIPYVILRLLKNAAVNIKNPYSVRDYIYVGDVVEAFMKSIKNAKRASGEIINIGSGKETIIKNMLKLLTKEIESKSKVTFETNKKHEAVWQADIKKAHLLLNWNPSDDLEEGIRKTVVWFKKNYNLYGY